LYFRPTYATRAGCSACLQQLISFLFREEMTAQEKKQSWPELVGKSDEEAKSVITADRPDVQVIVMNKNSPCTRDLCWTRVRIFVDDGHKVVSTPTTG